MKRINNADSGAYVRSRTEFIGSNLRGAWVADVFIVYSYATPIVVYSNRTNKYFISTERFSVTTSKHQSQATRWEDAQFVSHGDLLRIIDEPTYIPLTPAEKKGIAVGTLCRVTRTGIYRKGSIVRALEVGGWDRIRVDPLFATRTKQRAWMGDDNITVLISQLEPINEQETEQV